MKKEISRFVDETIKLELNVSELYQFFYARFPEDSQFWWSLSMEEINHASLIRTIDDLIFPEGMFQMANIEAETEKIRKINRSIISKIEEFSNNKPSRYEAFTYALTLENSSGEIHYELFMNEVQESKVEKIFQKLNGEDKNHAGRIEDYMRSNGITNPERGDCFSSYPG